jgi:hypothetical protein
MWRVIEEDNYTPLAFDYVLTYTCMHSSMNMHIFSLLHTGLPPPQERSCRIHGDKRIWGRTGVSHAECSGIGMWLVISTRESEGKVPRTSPPGLDNCGSPPRESRTGQHCEMQRRNLSATRIFSQSEHSMRKKKRERSIWYVFQKGAKQATWESKKQKLKSPRSACCAAERGTLFPKVSASFLVRNPS